MNISQSIERKQIEEWVYSKELVFLNSGQDVLILGGLRNTESLSMEARKRFGQQIKIKELNVFEFNEKMAVQKKNQIKINQEAPYNALFKDMIKAAKDIHASDIHIEPTRVGIDIRFRVYGDLTLWKQLTKEHRQSFITEVKRLSNISIAITNRPQDGRVSFHKWCLNIRVSTMPSQFGEKIVFRLLELDRKFSLTESGLSKSVIKTLRGGLKQTCGVILVSGPTGSGKTTTLYSMVNELDRDKKNVLTIEDPIEYEFDKVTQIQVKGGGMGFFEILRGCLRQDPDVMLVGEIRDAETAKLAFQAAATGHLVLSTVHANSASEVIVKLINLGIDEYMIRANLKLSVAQRLVQRLCKGCAIEILDKGLELDARLRKRNIDGCSLCRDRLPGVDRLVPIFEYIEEKEIKSYLESKMSNASLNYRTLRDESLEKVRKGEIDCEDVLEVA